MEDEQEMLRQEHKAEHAHVLAQQVEQVLTEGDEGEEVFSVEVKQMADGTGRWAAFTGTVDADGNERTYRAVVNHNLTVDAEELN